MKYRIVLVTYGSLGDLHSYLAVAIGLRERGHDVLLATSANYRLKVEGEGVAFHPLPPDIRSAGAGSGGTAAIDGSAGRH
ncbi:glycosyltransferase [Gloeobacter kilaueensis]|uniref:glycosyltransferase n=1 Tax=Gloeobacter kilaueensis TaxID=1416614 RepID=UPI0003F94E6B|nr:glycosyltransferase [Gloeobacter kilaueensis]